MYNLQDAYFATVSTSICLVYYKLFIVLFKLFLYVSEMDTKSLNSSSNVDAMSYKSVDSGHFPTTNNKPTSNGEIVNYGR